jgi:hypothetical protein
MNEFLDALIQMAAFALLSAGTVVVPWVGARIAAALRLKDDQRVRGYLLNVLETAVEFGQAEARRRILASVGDIPRDRVANIAAELARDYVQQRVPDALARFKIDTVGLDQMIRARLPVPRPPVG